MSESERALGEAGSPTSADEVNQPAAGDDTPTQAAPNSAPATPVSRYAMGSAKNLARSLLIILAAMAVLFLAVPRPNQAAVGTFDVSAVAQQVKRTNGPTVLLAEGLPKEWGATSARYVRSKQSLMMWQATYLTPDKQNATVQQIWPKPTLSSEKIENWLRNQTGRGTIGGEVQIDGATWVKRDRTGKVQRSLVRRAEGEVVVVTGTASFAQLEELAKSLRPYSGS